MFANNLGVFRSMGYNQEAVNEGIRIAIANILMNMFDYQIWIWIGWMELVRGKNDIFLIIKFWFIHMLGIQSN